MTRVGDAGRAWLLRHLCLALAAKFGRIADRREFEAAEASVKKSKDLAQASGDNELLATYTNIYVAFVNLRAGEAGDTGLQDLAIELTERACGMAPRPSCHDLAHLHYFRFERHGEQRDLQAAIKLMRKAVQRTPPDSLDYGGRVEFLVQALVELYQRDTGDFACLQRPNPSSKTRCCRRQTVWCRPA